MKKCKALFPIAAGLLAAVTLNAGQAPDPGICVRACWGARAPNGSIGQSAVLNRAIVHHTADVGQFNTTSLGTSQANMRTLQNYCMDSLGYTDIMYNFCVDKLGNIFEARSGSMTGIPNSAHDGVNSGSFGYTLMGYFHPPYNHVPTTQMMNSYYNVIAWRQPSAWSPYGAGGYAGYGAGVGWLASHKAVFSTACPGDNIHNVYVGNNVNAGVMRDQVWARKNPPPPQTLHDVGNRIAFNPATSKGYELDAFGAIWRINNAPAVTGAAYWSGWDIARDFAITAWNTPPKGYTLDGYGSVHPFGGQAAATGGPYWSGWDIARALQVDTAAGNKGYVLAGLGSVHPFNGAPAITSAPGFGIDIARDLVTVNWSNGKGYVLDGYGAVHRVNGATAVTTTGYWSGWDIARALVMNPTTLKGYVLTGLGSLHPVNGAPAITSGPGFSIDIARDVVITDWNTGKGYVLDGFGAWHPVNGAPAVTGAPYFFW